MSSDRILAVDLESALLGAPLRTEAFWAALAQDWRSLPALLGGAAPDGGPDPEALAYRAETLAALRDWRGRGAATVLVTAGDAAAARRIAAHLGLFDEVLEAPDGGAALLGERFGAEGFVYLGGPARGGTARAALRALRPHQWSKNLLVFLPMLAGHRFDAATLAGSLLAFLAFSLTASSVYVLNDLLDLAADRRHPRKRLRPFASGALPLGWGGPMAAGLLAAGLLLGALAGPVFLALLAGYYGMTLAYSLTLKRRLVIDICTLAGLYTLRIIGGGAATGIPLSLWLLAFSMFFFFALAAVKRQGELVESAALGQDRVGGRGYAAGDLPIVAGMALASGYVSIMVMALYVNATAATGLYATPELLWGICPVLFYWISRVVMIAHRGWMHDDPVVYAFRDGISRLCFLAVLACVLAAATRVPF